jgi:hypothetical protein
MSDPTSFFVVNTYTSARTNTLRIVKAIDALLDKIKFARSITGNSHAQLLLLNPS